MEASLATPAAVNAALYNHLVLPAKLPQRREHERQIRLIENALISRLVAAATVMCNAMEPSLRLNWESLRQTLVSCQELNRGGRIDKDTLLRELQNLDSSGCLILNVETQNAGLVIRRAQDPIFNDCVVFEAFEASAKNEDVLATKDALLRDFPGIAVAVPHATFTDGDFQLNIANFLEQASLETTKSFAAHTFKAGAVIYEYRNTGDPSIITSLFMAILEENGRRVAPTLLRKRVRDDVCWNRAEKPWRRLPFWLVIRVGLQRFLSAAMGAEIGRLEYKFFICVVLSRLLDDAPGFQIDFEQLHFLRKKICRRLAKLDLDKQRCPDQDPASARYASLFDFLGPKFEKTIALCSDILDHTLRQERASLHKHIPLLPRKASDGDTQLSLRISHRYLRSALQSFVKPRNNRRTRVAPDFGLAEAAKDHLSQYAQHYHTLIDRELELSMVPGKTCSQISRQIRSYTDMALPLYKDNPEQKSQMLLTVMELWLRMDAIACKKLPLLLEYHPVFHPQMLDVLLLHQFSDMARLDALQTSLSVRVRNANKDRRNIFEDPSPGCFGERYYTESEYSASFQEIHEAVLDMADDLREKKQSEWERKSQRYDDLIRRIDTSACVYFVDNNDPLGRGQHDPYCPRCAMMVQSQKMHIEIFEHPLPSDEVITRAVIFELACPDTFAIYRDTTWWLLRQLASPFNDGGNKPKCMLHDYGQLRPFFQSDAFELGLASTTKSFMDTHYTHVPFPVEWEGGREGVCRPNGLKLGLFDQQTSTWPGRLRFRPTFAHHTALVLPRSSPFSQLLGNRTLAIDGTGPSSYEIVASQASCPAGLNAHEFIAMQTVMSGKAQRWIALLTELASTNLNFSSEATMLIVTHLALHCGPEDDEDLIVAHSFKEGEDARSGVVDRRGKDILRKVHKIFRDQHFCDRLVDQLMLRLDSLEANWRETYLMDVVITVLLRTYSLTATDPEVSLKALRALVRARQICLRWVEMLRAETYKGSDVQSARRCQQYALWAAILCKRTFFVHRDQAIALDESSLKTYIECCITVQDNLVVEVGALPQVLHHAVVSDIKLAYRLGPLVCDSIVTSPTVFRDAIRAVWPEQDNSPRQLVDLRSAHPGWVVCDTQENIFGHSMQVQYNYIQGLLLVDNRPLGKLPKAPEHVETLNELFEDQALLTRPSDMRGMEYSLCMKPNNYRIDVGFDADTMVVRATKNNQFLQFIPRRHFRTESSWDLPLPLLEGCFHWLDLQTGKVFIMQASDKWAIGGRNGRNWVLDINQRTCYRWRSGSRFDKDLIVDTYSALFNRVTKIFDGFESRENIVVYQPYKKHMEVEIKRLQLLFYVNSRQLLQSPQLGTEIDVNQDAGTCVDVLTHWGSLVKTCRQQQSPFALMFILGPIAFSSTTDMSLIRTLTAFAIFEELKVMDLPMWEEYEHFRPHQSPQLEQLVRMIEPFMTPPPKVDGDELHRFASAKQLRKMREQRAAWKQRSVEDCKFLANFLLNQWPCVEPDVAELPNSLLVDIGAALTIVRVEWKRLYQNLDLSMHLDAVQDVLKGRQAEEEYEAPAFIASEETYQERLRGGEVPLLRCDLIKKTFPALPLAEPCHQNNKTLEPPSAPERTVKSTNISAPVRHPAHIHKPIALPSSSIRSSGTNVLAPSWMSAKTSLIASNDSSSELKEIVSELANSKSLVRQTYAADLQRSLDAFVNRMKPTKPESSPLLLRDTSSTLMSVQRRFEAIQQALEKPDIAFSAQRISWLQSGQLWPAITTVTLLEQLRSTASSAPFGKHVKETFIDFALSITSAQRHLRIVDCNLRGNAGRYEDELANHGHSNWEPSEYPDWLLLEIEANLLIRPDQVDVALATISPASRSNSVLQMNMGQGKTSCIIPMVAAALADRQNLRLLDDRVPEAGPMINVQTWLRSRCRDILDESDHTLAVRTQLIYPSGSQSAVDGHPHRWQVAEAVLHLVDRHCYSLAHYYPRSIEVVRRPGGEGFPLLFFLRPDVEEELVRRLTADILRGTAGILPVQNLNGHDRRAVQDFLTNGKPREATVQHIRRICPDRPSVRQTIYLLRGILVNRILMMTLKKRWNVQYGLHPYRDPIAVPFHAKGVPSEQSEWGHPDVAILFTCLAFYYDGISVAQLTQSLEHLLKSDDPSAEYDKWTQTTNAFPDSLRAWNSINVDDDLQLAEIWKAVRYNSAAIDYFMNNFVFPQHAKQFRVKLQSNGWDIPLFSVGGSGTSSSQAGAQDAPTALTTGFSGTNDNRTMLPLTIKQEDLPGLSHTNAEVLTYLLGQKSRGCDKIVGPYGGRASETDFLKELKRQKLRILIDAGAQILEMSNFTLVKNWLLIDDTALAALYFDEQNRPYIYQRTGRQTPLLASPFADDLTDCLVYLDEAHTRGTDLKLPPTARGALTLGLCQTKDHTVQAAMRLRQLGTTQSVTFFAPPEVYQSILDLRCKPPGSKLDSHDVICWLLDNTCDGIEQLQPLYYAQGVDFCRRMQAAVENPDFLRDKQQREDYIAAVKQKEQHSLQQLYEPKTKIKGTGEFRSSSDQQMRSFVKELNVRRKAFQDNGRAVHASALQEVEQEREVAFEVETVRQVKKPRYFPCLTFPGLHEDLELFARKGRIPAGSQAFVPVLKSMSKTGIGKKFKVRCRDSQAKLFVSAEFERTIKLTFDSANDNFLRNVNWIIWSEIADAAVIIIPEEAEALLPLMRRRKARHGTHLVTYSAPVTRKMLHFGDLNFFSIPPLPEDWSAPTWLRLELGLYAGRLYFEWDEYKEMCDLLGIDEASASMEYLADISDEDLVKADADGTARDGNASKSNADALTSRPLSFLQEWLATRRRGQDFVSTPMGFVAQGKPLQEDHPFFRKADAERREKNLFAPVHMKPEDHDENDHSEYGFDGIDNMGANQEADSDADEDEIEYNESEFGSDVDRGEASD
ncbi:hypothetical protein C8035_v009994 [Colletotrichum spinosum]|uniref:ubiquitinyl hydrolase 1 n=1 Tax=Colletotrichum spinosum TaxID=1347390 RepID=A0A4R8QC19_9PEZI|nr:hypothetical protein C8035_v009994 [Colletotrichum spinosum]